MSTLRIKSTVGAAIQAMAELRERVVDAQKAACDPASWTARAREVAEAAIGAIPPKPYQDRFVKPFVERVAVTGLAVEVAGFELALRGMTEMEMPFPMRLMQYAAAQSGHRGTEAFRLKGMFLEHRDEAYRFILAWVRSGNKRKDERDAGKSDEDIARGIYQILFKRQRDWNTELAAQSLLRSTGQTTGGGLHLVDFLEQWAEERGLSAETVEEWLLSILIAWRVMVRQEWRLKFWAAMNRNGVSAAAVVSQLSVTDPGPDGGRHG